MRMSHPPTYFPRILSTFAFHSLSLSLHDHDHDHAVTLLLMTKWVTSAIMQSNNPNAVSKTKPRRSTVACKACHARRVRCDASTKSLPCSNCASQSVKCELIDSKRVRLVTCPSPALLPLTSMNRPEVVRGASFQPTQKERPQELGSSSEVPVDRPPSSILSHSVDGGFDVQGLVCGGQDRSMHLLVPARFRDRNPSVSIPVATDTRGHEVSFTGRPSYPGESWYLSFIFQNTNNSFGHLHRPISKEDDGPKSIPTPGPSHSDSGQQDIVDASPSPWPRDLPARSTRDLLVDAYFTRFHTFCPIIQKSKFIDDLSTEVLSITLLRSVLFVASIHCDVKILYRMGYDSRNDAAEDLFRTAKADFNAGVDKDRLSMIQTSFLLHYWWGQLISFKDSTWWLSGAINAAQAMGMHRSTETSQMAPECRRLWRRIWWLLYVNH